MIEMLAVVVEVLRGHVPVVGLLLLRGVPARVLLLLLRLGLLLLEQVVHVSVLPAEGGEVGEVLLLALALLLRRGAVVVVVVVVVERVEVGGSLGALERVGPELRLLLDLSTQMGAVDLRLD